MVSAPKGVARALQRLGRSGHSMGATSHGLLVASNINDLAECAATARMMERRLLEPVKIHENPLDVLAQTLVGLAVYGSTTADEAFELVRRSYPYRTLGRDLFDRVLRYLEGGGVSLERNYRGMFGKVRLDAEGRLTLATPAVARSLYQNVGTITSESMVLVRLGRRNIGQIEESFMRRMNPGDVFVLNGRRFRLVKTHLLTVQVKNATSSLPTIPRWYANKMLHLPRVWPRRLSACDPGSPPTSIPSWLQSEYGLSAWAMRGLSAPISRSRSEISRRSRPRASSSLRFTAIPR